ncbi:MAG: CYTH domain-containing protein [Lentimicrobiaceae bacterium]|jgi:adenylate cyclase|nr:CYTH domain-containing protein [Lentimicrobiaceae bacterium]
MAIEIERKFLVKGDFRPFVYRSIPIKQAYLIADSMRSVRVRTKGNQAYLTIKGKTDQSGISRFEFEKEITTEEANELFQLCEPHFIEKTRHLIEVNGFVFEVDEFFGANAGLFIAEIELPSADTHFTKPEWLGEEVTGNPHYYNSSLLKHPFKNW